VGKVIWVEATFAGGEGFGVVSGALLAIGRGEEETLGACSSVVRRCAVAGGTTVGREEATGSEVAVVVVVVSLVVEGFSN
jgi:hypothetical protein